MSENEVKRFDEQIENWFTYHSPKHEQLERYQMLRDKAKELAYDIIVCCPEGADRSAAIRKLRECVMTANAAIACE